MTIPILFLLGLTGFIVGVIFHFLHDYEPAKPIPQPQLMIRKPIYHPRQPSQTRYAHSFVSLAHLAQ